MKLTTLAKFQRIHVLDYHETHLSRNRNTGGHVCAQTRVLIWALGKIHHFVVGVGDPKGKLREIVYYLGCAKFWKQHCH